MKVGILTFSAAVNYGAVLQAYALKEVVASMGHDVHVIDYKPKYITKSRRPGLRSLNTYDGWSMWYKYLRGSGRRFLREVRFAEFRKRYLNLDSYKSKLSKGFDYDFIIIGSDQIWNPYITSKSKAEPAFDPVMFGDISGCDSIAVAYGGSVGSLKNIQDQNLRFIGLLKHFKYISAREKNLTEHINLNNPNLNVHTVIDPTLLAGAKIFDNIATPRLIKSKYLLYFDLLDDKLLREKSIKLAEALNLDFCEVSIYHEYVKGQELLPPVSPEQFCSLIKYAAFVATTSFHGTVFSILFHRDFYSFGYGIEDQMSDRALYLLRELGLDEKFICGDIPDTYSKIDWSKVDHKLLELRQNSLNYLSYALS